MSMWCGGWRHHSECDHVCVCRGQLSTWGVASQELSKLPHITTSLTVLEPRTSGWVFREPQLSTCLLPLSTAVTALHHYSRLFYSAFQASNSCICAKHFSQQVYFPCPRSLLLLSSPKTFVCVVVFLDFSLNEEKTYIRKSILIVLKQNKFKI